jgi:hypothetical protein
VREALLSWFEENARDLPWRRTRDPWRILVSEVMLQQIQVKRATPFYERFLARFPTVEALAGAPLSDAIRVWGDLGRYRRVVNLHRTARIVVDGHGGKVPSDPDALLKLPGLGPYTAGAVACFAYERDVAFGTSATTIPSPLLSVSDEVGVGGEGLAERPAVGPVPGPLEATEQFGGHALRSLGHILSSSLEISVGRTLSTTMMPPQGSRCPRRGPVHPTLWKEDSRQLTWSRANFYARFRVPMHGFRRTGTRKSWLLHRGLGSDAHGPRGGPAKDA